MFGHRVNDEIRLVLAHSKFAKATYGAKVAIIKAAEHNLSSRRVAERLGFEYCGTLPNNEVVNDKIVNHVIYAYCL